MTQPLSSDLSARVAGYKQQADQARQLRANADHQSGVAEAAIQHAMGELKTDFGVDTLEDAQALLATLEGKVRDEEAAVITALQAAAS